MASLTGNKIVAKKRGTAWKSKLVEGRLEAELHPSKLKLSRFRRLMSQEKVAQDLGISLATYGAIERGRRLVSETKVKKIATHLKVQPKDIFKEHKKGKYIVIK